MIAFLALLFVLLVIYAMTKTKEGFNPMNTSPEHRINIPVNEIPSMLAPASRTAAVKGGISNTVSTPASNGSIFPECDVKASAWPGMLPGPLPTAPYEQIAVGSPLPYQDTTLIKANRQQLINLLEMIKGFLAFEAQEISERSDPTIQLPLQTARTDFHVLQAEVEVLNRNPGIQPNITLSHLNEIASNLAFLQSEVRLIGSAGPIQGPIYEFTKPVEGFFGDSPDAKKGGNMNGGAKTSGKNKDKRKMQLSAEMVRAQSQSDTEKRLAERNRPFPSNMDLIKTLPSTYQESLDGTIAFNREQMDIKQQKNNLSKEEYNRELSKKIKTSAFIWLRQYGGYTKEEAEAGATMRLKQELPTTTYNVPIDEEELIRDNIGYEFFIKMEPEKKAGRATAKEDARAPRAPRAPRVAEEEVEKEQVVTVGQSTEAALNAAKQELAKSALDSIKAANKPQGQGEPPSKPGTSEPAPVGAPTSSDTNATVQELKDFILRINCESVRLSADGATDPNKKARIVALANIKSDLNSIIKEAEMDPTTVIDIPKALLNKALPTLGNIHTPIPNLINKIGLSSAFGSLFKPNMTNDPKVTKENENMADKYLRNFMDGISFSVKYTSPREAEAGCGTRSEQFMNAAAERKRKSASTIETTGFPSFTDLDNISNAKFSPMDSGLFITDRYAPLPSDAGRGPSHFDWKTRSKEIEGQVKKRGLKPDDFGIMPPNTRVSNDFSWRGYARMICTRLLATMDPNLPVACGCPPMDWPGWRNAQ